MDANLNFQSIAFLNTRVLASVSPWNQMVLCAPLAQPSLESPEPLNSSRPGQYTWLLLRQPRFPAPSAATGGAAEGAVRRSTLFLLLTSLQLLFRGLKL